MNWKKRVKEIIETILFGFWIVGGVLLFISIPFVLSDPRPFNLIQLIAFVISAFVLGMILVVFGVAGILDTINIYSKAD